MASERPYSGWPGPGKIDGTLRGGNDRLAVSALAPLAAEPFLMPRESPSSKHAIPICGQPIVRETVCKTILNRSGLSDYSLNCYTGCTHACVYCYARFMQRFHPHEEPWGAFVDVKVNAVEVLKRQLRRAEPGTVFVSSACDGWQPVEAQWRLTRRCCELLLERGFELHVLSKSALVLRDLDVFAGRPVQLGVTLTTLDERLQELWEPGAASIAERLQVIEAVRRAGLQTGVMFGPLLPFLSDSQAAIDALLGRAAALGVERIWFDGLNPRPRVWPAVAELLRTQFPELLASYRKMLFDPPSRALYLKELRDRIEEAARRTSLTDRVTACM
jgi:DNA repair photolyase